MYTFTVLEFLKLRALAEKLPVRVADEWAHVIPLREKFKLSAEETERLQLRVEEDGDRVMARWKADEMVERSLSNKQRLQLVTLIQRPPAELAWKGEDAELFMALNDKLGGPKVVMAEDEEEDVPKGGDDGAKTP